MQLKSEVKDEVGKLGRAPDLPVAVPSVCEMFAKFITKTLASCSGVSKRGNC